MNPHVATSDSAQLPAQPLAAMQVLRLVEDTRASTADLARVIEADPALSARVMRLANSPYYGLSRRVASASRAVVLLGFSAVRALAVSAAFGLMTEDPELGPPGFWAHSVITAIGASVVARSVGGTMGDAFSAGLLHDLGHAVATPGSPETADHAAFGAAMLEGWHFPAHFVRAVALHHRPADEVADALGRVVIAGESLSLAIDDHSGHDEPTTPVDEALEALAIPVARAPILLAEVQREADKLARFLGAG